jgi:hypothetical protein
MLTYLALWALSNATSGGTQEQIEQLVANGFLEVAVEFLGLKDAKVIIVALEGIENVLKTSSGTGAAHTLREYEVIIISV